MLLEKLISNLKFINLFGDGQIDIKNITIDSKAVLPGDLFICLTGSQNDGHNHFKEALYNGAVAIVTQKKLKTNACQIVVEDSRAAMTQLAQTFYDYPAKKLKMIGVTGTNGKTTVSYMVKSILQAAGKKTGIIGTLGIYYDKKSIAPELTTPDPICLNKTLKDMCSCGVEYVVMELSAHALHFQKTGDTVFEAVAFTNLSQDHLDFFKTMQQYKAAKQKIFETNYIKTAIFNFDDPVGIEFAKISHAPYITYAINNPSDVFAINIEQSIGGSTFVLNLMDEICQIRLRTFGIFNISNALAAASICRVLNIGLGSIEKGLVNLLSVPGRLEYIGTFKDADIFVDFAHTPQGIENVLKTLKTQNPTRLICAFGCGGNRDRTKRALMGEMAAKLSDFVIVTSDNPRYEDPLDIICDIEKGVIKATKNYVTIQDRKEAIFYATQMLKQGDILLIAGKGGETYQEIMGIKHSYNDKTVITQIINQLTKNV